MKDNLPAIDVSGAARGPGCARLPGGSWQGPRGTAGTALPKPRGCAAVKRPARRDFEASPAGMDLHLVRPARKDEPHRAFPGWLRQRVEALI